jgi:hypothetical protein
MDQAAFKLVAVDHDARILATVERDLNVQATAAREGRAVVHEIIDLPPGPATIRVGVASRTLGKTGTVHVPVTIPNLGRDRLAMTGLLIGLADLKPSPDVTRIADVLPFEPTATRTFKSAEVLQLAARMFWRARDGDQVTVTTAIKDGERVIRRSEQVVKGAPGVVREREATWRADLALQAVPPGSYQVEVVARLRSGTVARQAVPITIQ